MAEDSVIRITEKDLPPETSNIAPRIIKIDDEDIEVSPDVLIGWKDILDAEAKYPQLTDSRKIPVSNRVPTLFSSGVLKNLRQDIKIQKEDGKQGRDLYRALATRYHPDLYQDASFETKNLAGEYSKAIQSLRQNGEI